MSKKLDEIAKRQMEEELYRVVANELKNDIIREGLMAKALVQSSGNKEQARVLYIQYRIQSIIDEVAVREAVEEKAEAERKKVEVSRKRAQKKAEAEQLKAQKKAEAERQKARKTAANEAWKNAYEAKYHSYQSKTERERSTQSLLLTGLIFGVPIFIFLTWKYLN